MNQAALLYVLWVLTIPGDANAPRLPMAAQTPALAPIDGYYHCQGRDNKKLYSGLAEIRKVRDIYLVQWLVNGQATVGVGMRQGDYLSVGWANKDMRGVHQFRIQGEGKELRLQGEWVALPGTGEVYSETLTFVMPLAGTEKSANR